MAFTKRAIEALPTTGEQYFHKDEKTPGLSVLVSQKGRKTFFLRRKIDGKDERIRLGMFPTMTVEQAQKKVTAINNAINEGANPNQAKRDIKGEVTFSEAFELYLVKKRSRDDKPLSPRTAEEYRKVVDTYLGSITGKKLSEIDLDTLRPIHSRIDSPAQSNKVKAIVGAVFNWAVDEGLTGKDAPVKGLKSRYIKSRERFLQPAEVKRFLMAVDASIHRDFFLLALLTGARRENLLSMQWREIDFTEAVWTVPKTKNGEAQRIPLSTEALHILKARKQQGIVFAKWVFPGGTRHACKTDGQAKKPAGHMHMPRRAWAAILKEAALDDHLRLHDLRRTLGSWQARQGTSMAVIGKTLGHKSQQATQIYARIDLDPVREAMESAAAALFEQVKR